MARSDSLMGLLVTGICVATALPSPAAASTNEVEATRSFLEIGANGVTRREASGTGEAGGGGTAAMIAGGALWTHADNGAGWTPRTVAVGAQGSQVFSQIESGYDRAKLISGFADDPATPAWENPLPLEATSAFVDSAETTDTHVTLHQIVLGGSTSTKQTVVCKYSSDSSTPDWTYTFPHVTAGYGRVAISANGSRIVAASHDMTQFKLKLAVFGPGSGTPQWAGEINFGTALRGFDLSADGSTLYVASGTTLYLWNTTTHATPTMYGLPGGFDSHAISGNGSVFAYGEFNKLHIFERQTSGSYLQTMVREIPGSTICTRVDVSADSSTVVAAWDYYNPQLKVRVEAIDVATHTVTMADEAIGTGTYQNAASDIAVNADGSRFAVGLWGDQGNVCPELRLYRRDSNTPVALHNLPGSVMDVDISADGTRVAVASKSVHANQYAGGGSIALYAFGDEDLRVLGEPSLGATLQVELSGPPNSPARLLHSTRLATTPLFLGAAGTLYLDRTTLVVAPFPDSDGSGWTAGQYALPANPSLVGTTTYLQGLFTWPRRVSNGFERVTILP